MEMIKNIITAIGCDLLMRGAQTFCGVIDSLTKKDRKRQLYKRKKHRKCTLPPMLFAYYYMRYKFFVLKRICFYPIAFNPVQVFSCLSRNPRVRQSILRVRLPCGGYHHLQ